MESGRLMTQTIACRVCRGIISHHWQLQDHAACTPPLEAVAAIVASSSHKRLTWCDGCQEYHLDPHVHLSRHLKRLVTRKLREW